MDEVLARLRADGLVTGPARLEAFGGGVSSDVWLVSGPEFAPFVVKRNLPKLRVKADWYADPKRLRHEFAYLEVVGRLVPGAVPRLLGTDPEAPYLAMEYLGEGFENWKAKLLAGRAAAEDARRAGEILGRIHAATQGDANLAARFDTLPLFNQLRLDPYLMATASRHPSVAAVFHAEVDRLASAKACLVHGDYSPKNMLVNPARFAVLDCETAWFGDPAFDLAFLLNHLHLKALYHAPNDQGLKMLITIARDAYFHHAGAAAADDRATSRLLLMLMLARVDGKSPVEYLDPVKQESVRRFVLARLPHWDEGLTGLTDEWFAHLGLP